MITRWRRFTIYLFAVCLAGLLGGCHSEASKRKRQLSTLHLHAEMRAEPGDRTERVQVFRAEPFWVTIDKTPFLTEGNVKAAKVIDVVGGFALQIQFDRQGRWRLEQATADLRGKHVAVFSQFVNPHEEKLNQGRWLAAPLVRTNITDGVFTFTPDATREEAEQIALGLNHVATKLQKGIE